MKKIKILTLGVCLFCAVILSGASDIRLANGGKLEIGNWKLILTAFTPNWHMLQPGSAAQVFQQLVPAPGSNPAQTMQFQLHLPGAAPGKLAMNLNAQDQGVEFKAGAKFEKVSPLNFFCFSAPLPVSLYAGIFFEADGRKIKFPEKLGETTIYSAPVKRFRLPTADGEVLLEGDFYLQIQDGRTWNGASFGLRIGFLPHTGNIQNTSMNFLIRQGKSGAFGQALGSVVRPPYIATAGKEWKPFEYHRNVRKGSALDFSAPLDAPAGKYGPLVVDKNGHFVFRDRPDVPVRFYGANFVGDSQLPNRQQAEELADRMAAFGFNAVRIHHHDNEIYERNRKDGSLTESKRRDRLEYFLSCLKKRGIYYTTDVYVSRRNIPAAELGGDYGIVVPREYKALFYIDDMVFENWKRWAREFLGHVNPHTGVALKDDPALITLSLINEGNPGHVWNASARSEKLYQEQFKRWRAKNPGGSFDRFISELSITRYEQMKQFLRELGCRALLTDQNFMNKLQLTSARSQYDFVDNHAYWDHPRFAENPWQLPVLPNQKNALTSSGNVPGTLFPTRLFGRGFTITEFDYAQPNAFRAVGPLLIGAYAAFQDWDGLFPFAYSHSLNSVINPTATGGFFDIATDPVKALAQRLGAKMFLFGKIAPAEKAFGMIVTEPFLKDGEAEAPAAVSNLGWVARVGTVASVDAAAGLDALIDIGAGKLSAKNVVGASPELIPELIRRGFLPKKCFNGKEKRFSSPDGALELNQSVGTLRVSAPGGEALALPAGVSRQGKYLDVQNKKGFGVFALLPVDGDELARSNRLVLMHLTNTQASGMTFANSSLDRLEKWGKTPFLAAHGVADVKLSLPEGTWKMYALKTSGERMVELPILSAAPGKANLVQLDNFRYPEAVLAYELIRDASF